MFSKVISEAVYGVDGFIINVEADISNGLPMFDMIGYLSSEVKEAKNRVRTALKNSGFILPPKKITINLSPANTKKEGSAFDLPIAVSILASLEIIPQQNLKNILIIGELSLNGEVKKVNGVLPMVCKAKEEGLTKCIVPIENAYEGAVVDGIDIIAVKNLEETVKYLKGDINILPTVIDVKKIFEEQENAQREDFSDIIGQEMVKRAVEVAVAGMHNVLIIGAPGTGKSMIAKRIPTIMPELTFEESIEITKIYSVTGMLSNNVGLVTKRPFRSPHHTISAYAMTGGGRIPTPGEISLSHNGVLFLDELPEFSKNVLEVMRQPLEDRKIMISRVNNSFEFPANFELVVAMNPCPCGYYPNYKKCSCTKAQVKKYLGKISQPLLDRIDINIEASVVPYDELANNKKSESSKVIRERIVKAQKIQKERYKSKNILFNSQLSKSEIDEFCILGQTEKDILKEAFSKLNFSARAYHRILKVARTIADLDESTNINVNHLAEAISYRSIDKKYWEN